MRVLTFSLIVSCLLNSTFGSINGPTENTPIRLSRSQPVLRDPPPHESSRDGTEQKDPSYSIEIIEPPNESFIGGKHFLVRLKVSVLSDFEEKFKNAYQKDGHGCLSLDDGPYHCWNFENAKILYVDAMDGNHTLVAKLYRDGSLQDETESKKIQFTMVHNPKLEDGLDFHSQNFASGDKDITMKEKDINNSVQVTYPVVQVLDPAPRVSYSGNNIEIKTAVQPTDPELFEKYFQHGFTCYNVDFATAHACYPLFQHNSNPIISGLNVGMHTIKASLINPETGELLHDSTVGRLTFFVAGESNVGAQFVAEINIHGKLHKVPLMQGGSILAQAEHVCSSLGSSGIIDDCVEPIKMHLVNLARQHNFLID